MTKAEARKQARQARQEAATAYQAAREHNAQVVALRLVRDNPNSSPAERLRAVELLLTMEKNGYRHI